MSRDGYQPIGYQPIVDRTRNASPPGADERPRDLLDLLAEAADELEEYIDHVCPPKLRDRYPTYAKWYARDIDLVNRIRCALSCNPRA